MAFLRINANHFDLSKVDQLLEPSFQAALREGLPGQTGLRYAVAGRDAEKVTTVTVWDTREHAETGLQWNDEIRAHLAACGYVWGSMRIQETFQEFNAAEPRSSSFLRVVTQHLDPSKRDQVAALASEIQAAIVAAPGLQHRFAGRGEDGHGLVATLWDTREHAEPGVPLGELEGKLVALGWTHGDPEVTEVFIESGAAVPA
jgi:heme-degrading monooxygenase HmoA